MSNELYVFTVLLNAYECVKCNANFTCEVSEDLRECPAPGAEPTDGVVESELSDLESVSISLQGKRQTNPHFSLLILSLWIAYLIYFSFIQLLYGTSLFINESYTSHYCTIVQNRCVTGMSV